MFEMTKRGLMGTVDTPDVALERAQKHDSDENPADIVAAYIGQLATNASEYLSKHGPGDKSFEKVHDYECNARELGELVKGSGFKPGSITSDRVCKVLDDAGLDLDKPLVPGSPYSTLADVANSMLRSYDGGRDSYRSSKSLYGQKEMKEE